ncbi:serine protease FAM111A isoform X2 [Danio rerio]|uniref:Serine protease FAM111A isoform X2 n=1 Tax=Danio rerio TaxID=7955 RepID=A0A8M2BD64_DANRE|nr:protein FAM111A-like [Danio rerio]|eukprot:XP_005165736.1 protein FAM111A-like [Danio rerio]
MSLLAIKSEKMKKMNKKKKMDKTGNHSIREFLVKMSTDNSSEARRISQSSENVQEKENDTSMKEEKGQRNNDRNPLQERTNDFSEEAQSNSNLQQSEEGQSHVFSFRHRYKKHAVSCDTSNTVFDALNSNPIFKNIMIKNKGREIVIRRSKGDVPRAAVKRDFPCCLIEKYELLDITFIKNGGNNPTEKKTVRRSFSKETGNIVTFNIKTTGGKKVKLLMRNRVLRRKVEDVCVYAFKDDKITNALQRDGRFINDIFKKRCGLFERKSETIFGMSQSVEHLDGKHFKIIVMKDNQQDSQNDSNTDVNSEVNAASSADLNKSADFQHDTINTEREKTQKQKSTNSSTEFVKKIPNSEETLEFLRAQFKDLLETLKQRKNLKNNSEVKKFFRAEYDKSVQSFLEVKKVKQLTGLSGSVCQIRVEGSAKGTGFLLFDRFILTNAHVIGEFDPFSRKLSKTFTAVFGYEDLEAKETKSVSIKQDVAAYYHGKFSMDRHLDFALLELDDTDEVADCPRLLNCYIHGPPPNRGGICIVGHPDGGVKKMDPCFIIEKEHLQEAANEHVLKNIEFIQVITQQSLAEKWEMHDNQIIYNSCFFHGSSGSPVFDEDCYLIGMHTGGYVYKGENGKTRSILEYCYSMQPILESIGTQAKKNGRSDILKLLSENGCLNLNMDDNDVEMEDLQDKGDHQ